MVGESKKFKYLMTDLVIVLFRTIDQSFLSPYLKLTTWVTFVRL